MVDIIAESKKLKSDLLEHEEEFINGQRDLNITLDQTDELYNSAVSSNETTASKILQDSTLLNLQTKLAGNSVKAYTVDTLVFNPREFSIKVRNFYSPRHVDEASKTTKRIDPINKIWEKLGAHSKDNMYTVPNFSFLYGMFDAEPIEAPKKKRKQVVKDKIEAQTKPEKVASNANSDQQDVMLVSAQKMHDYFVKLMKKSENGKLCFYEFVIDPESYTRTIENIFLVSLVLKMGGLSISLDEQKLPFLKLVPEAEKRSWDTTKVQQTVLSLTMDEWRDIIKTFKFNKSVIPPRLSQIETIKEKNPKKFH